MTGFACCILQHARTRFMANLGSRDSLSWRLARNVLVGIVARIGGSHAKLGEASLLILDLGNDPPSSAGQAWARARARARKNMERSIAVPCHAVLIDPLAPVTALSLVNVLIRFPSFNRTGL